MEIKKFENFKQYESMDLLAVSELYKKITNKEHKFKNEEEAKDFLIYTVEHDALNRRTALEIIYPKMK